MHRSGTSAITRLLNLAGLYFGPDGQIMKASAGDKAEGYWGNRAFVEVNDDLLRSLNGTWDKPPESIPSWTSHPQYAVFLHRVRGLTADLEGNPPWGWKDPRNCLTLGFWRSAVADLKVVLCLRNPLEVARSLST